MHLTSITCSHTRLTPLHTAEVVANNIEERNCHINIKCEQEHHQRRQMSVLMTYLGQDALFVQLLLQVSLC